MEARIAARAGLAAVALTLAVASSRAQDFGTAGGYEPDFAFRNGVNGKAILNCAVDPKGKLSNCTLVSEAPTDLGFGHQALLMAKDGAIVLKPLPPGVDPINGGVTNVTVPFILPPGHADPVNQAFFEGWDAFRSNQFDLALQDFGQAVGLRPDFAPARLGEALVLHREGKIAQAISAYDETIKLRYVYRPRVQVMDTSGRPYFGEQNVDYASAFLFRGELHAQQGDSALATADYKNAVAEANNDLATFVVRASLLFERGVARRRLGDKTGGDADIARATALSPKIGDSYAKYDVAP